jgi:hypothetical protein
MTASINKTWWKLKWKPEINELDSYLYNHEFKITLPWYIALVRISMWVLGISSIPLIIAGGVICECVSWWGMLLCIFAMLSWIYIVIAEDKYFTWLELSVESDAENYFQTIIEPHNKEQQRLADEWRENHPLEEKCRLAMSKNPNYVADLIRYVKERRDDELC